MKLTSFVLLIVCITFSYSAIVYDLNTISNNFTCLESTGVSQVGLRAYQSFGAIDITAQQNILGSNAAGLSTDLLMYPCKGKGAPAQVNQLITYLDVLRSNSTSPFAYQTGTIWLALQTNPSPGCSWGNAYRQNCDYIQSLVSSIQGLGRSVGIYSNQNMWLQIIGQGIFCNVFTTLPLWYVHLDNQPNFNDWPSAQFGGWTQPTLKKYAASLTICDTKVDLSYY